MSHHVTGRGTGNRNTLLGAVSLLWKMLFHRPHPSLKSTSLWSCPGPEAAYSLVDLKLLESSFPSESKVFFLELHPQSEGSPWLHPEQIFLFSGQPIQHVETAATPPVSKHFQPPCPVTSAWLPALTILPGLPPRDLRQVSNPKPGRLPSRSCPEWGELGNAAGRECSPSWCFRDTGGQETIRGRF